MVAEQETGPRWIIGIILHRIYKYRKLRFHQRTFSSFVKDNRKREEVGEGSDTVEVVVRILRRVT
jgi:hypothetical protein